LQTLRAYKTELDPTNKQRSAFVQCAGAARFVFNWALADRQFRYGDGLKTNMYEQKRRFNEIKRVDAPWLYSVPYALQEQEFRNVDQAFKNFFRRVKAGQKPGYPKFKRHGGHKKFTLRGSIHIEDNRVKLPRIGWVRLRERSYLPSETTVKLLSVSISEKAGRWFVSAQVREEMPDPQSGNTLVIGVDFGLKTLAVLSNGKTFENPHALIVEQRELARLQRELARRKKGGANWYKTKAKVARCYARIANVRRHVLHDISHYCTATLKPKTIVLEDLNVSGMMKNRHLSKAISDVGFAELRREIEYKAAWHGIEVIIADMWYASSKTCSRCGHKRETLKLSERTFVCPVCGLEIDRDRNAALNLAALDEGANGPGLSAELGCGKALL